MEPLGPVRYWPRHLTHVAPLPSDWEPLKGRSLVYVIWVPLAPPEYLA